MSYPYPDDLYDPYEYQRGHNDHYHYHGHRDYRDGREDCHHRAPRRRDCDILTPLASGALRTRGEWVCVDLPRHISGERPLTLTAVTAEGVTRAAIDPTCGSCRSEYGLALRVTIPLSLTLVDCRGYQRAVCSTIRVCVPVTQCSCERIPKNAQVRVKACVSLAKPACIDECERHVDALLDMRIDAYIVGCLPVREECDICPPTLPWYPQPFRPHGVGEWGMGDY